MTPEEALELKKSRCINRCNFVFYPTKTTSEQTNEGTTEKVNEGILLCQACAFSEDIEFD